MDSNMRSCRALCATLLEQQPAVELWCAPNPSHTDIKGGFPKAALYAGSRLSFPLSHERFVMRLLATGLRDLNFFVLPLETTCILFDYHGLFNEILRSIPLIDSGTIPLRRSLNHGPDLGECWDFALATVLLVVPARKTD
jgi:hypothetical protein